MAGKYFWDGVDIQSITGASASNYTNSAGTTIFASFPGAKQANLPGYKTYTSNGTNEPPFYDNGVSIFRNIQVASSSSTSSNMSSYASFTTPDWANACKIYLVSKKGSDGANASGIAAENVNTRNNNDYNYIENENNNHNTNRRNRNNNRNDNRHNNHNAKWSAQGSFTGGSGGQGRVYSTSKAFILNSNDEVQYKMNSSGSECKIVNSGGTTRANVILTNGGNGTNATASSTTTNRNITAYHDNRRNNATNVDAVNVGLGNDAGERHANNPLHYENYFQDNNGTINPNNKLNNAWPTIAHLNLKQVLNANAQKGLLYEGNWEQNELKLVSGSNGSNGSNGAKTTETVLSGYNSSNSATTATSQRIDVYWFKI